MPIIDILIRSMSGYIFLIPGIALYFLYLKKSGKKQTITHIIAAFIFCYYLIGLLTMTGINSFKSFSPRLVLVPFLDMINSPIDTILNIVLFLPLGFLLPLLYKKCCRPGRIVFISFLLSISVEIIQMFGMGATDINDLIANIAGACLGYYIYKLLLRQSRKELWERFQAVKISDYNALLFFVVYSFVVMVSIQPLLLSKLFQLG